MKKLALAAFAAAVAFSTAASATTIYSSGPTIGDTNGYGFGPGSPITTSFTLNTAAIVSGFTFGGWTYNGNIITSVGWGISTNRSATVPLYNYISPNTAAVTAGPVLNQQFGAYEVRDYRASVASFSLGAGTYWLTLSDVVATDRSAFWDVNNGNTTSFTFGVWQIPALSFSINGPDTSAVPEPASWAMFIGGFGLMGAALRRKKANVVFA